MNENTKMILALVCVAIAAMMAFRLAQQAHALFQAATTESIVRSRP
jgi:hypothetical protein